MLHVAAEAGVGRHDQARVAKRLDPQLVLAEFTGRDGGSQRGQQFALVQGRNGPVGVLGDPQVGVQQVQRLHQRRSVDEAAHGRQCVAAQQETVQRRHQEAVVRKQQQAGGEDFELGADFPHGAVEIAVDLLAYPLGADLEYVVEQVVGQGAGRDQRGRDDDHGERRSQAAHGCCSRGQLPASR